MRKCPWVTVILIFLKTSFACCKWYNNKPAIYLASNFDGVSGVSNVMRQTKGSATKTALSCPNIINLYNKDSGMGDFDIKDQKQLLADSS